MNKEQVFTFRKRYLYVAVGVIVLIFVLAGGKGVGVYKDVLERFKKKNDSLILVHQKRTDSLITIADQTYIYADEIIQENDLLRNRNNRLNYENKQKAKSLRVIDTIFISNARRISNSTDRFYKENDSIR
tara:strand:- start:316 stop:705 length:390 start_codon:yes stop_codon:yes gene_type:complete